ncbi:MAG: TRAM domain-containing protein, partial [Maioricimonas sp. JB045]
KNSFIFKYSPRPGTKADDLFDDDVPESVKKRRNNELLALQTEISEEDNAEFIGRTVEILVEGPSKKASRERASMDLPGWHDAAKLEATDDGAGADTVPADSSGAAASAAMQLVGRTKCDRIVVFDGNPRLAGTLAEVRVEDCTATTLLGAIVTREVQHGSAGLLPILS